MAKRPRSDRELATDDDMTFYRQVVRKEVGMMLSPTDENMSLLSRGKDGYVVTTKKDMFNGIPNNDGFVAPDTFLNIMSLHGWRCDVVSRDQEDLGTVVSKEGLLYFWMRVPRNVVADLVKNDGLKL